MTAPERRPFSAPYETVAPVDNDFDLEVRRDVNDSARKVERGRLGKKETVEIVSRLSFKFNVSVCQGTTIAYVRI